MMEKTNILSEALCIQKITSVLQGHISNSRNLLTVKERHSDAFVYIVEGSCTYHFDDGIEFRASVGDVFYLPYRSAYTMCIHTDEYRFIFCDFCFCGADAKYSVLCPHQEQRCMDNLFMKLLKRYHSMSCSAYTECMSILYDIYSTLQQSTQKSYIGKSKERIIIDAKRFIDENSRLPHFSIAQLAERIDVSEVYLRKLFKTRYGISPSGYLIAVRLENAKKLMRYHFLTLEDCALQSGFSSLQYFCRLFKKEVGISPGKYRKDLLCFLCP